MRAALRTAARYAHTLRHLRPVQTVGRLVVETRRRAGLVRVPAPPAGVVARPVGRVPFLDHDPWNTAAAVRAGRLTFLDETRELGWPVRWDGAEDAPLLWRFNLHYHGVLAGLAEADRLAFVRSWMAAHPEPGGVAWHPYTTALRIVHWVHAGVATAPDVAASLYRQAAWLLRVREVYHPGNHLIENARALVLAGAALAGHGEADRWRAVGTRTLRRETPDQVLPDGGYFERSPMYHALMLVAYGDVLNVADRPEPWLVDAVARMADALASLRHPDGALPLFNDATEEIAPDPADVLAYAEALTGRPAAIRDAFPDTGHYVLRDDRAHIVVDAGPIGPDHLPAHAHADVFTFEASFGGHRFVVDTGTSTYEPDATRRYERSTAAHNTVGVDGVDQAECWGSFRVARRYPPREVRFAADDRAAEVRGVFDGYAALIGDGLRHTREVRLDRADQTLVVADRVTGGGRHVVTGRLHFHPEVAVLETEAGYLLSRNGVRIRLAVRGGTSALTTSPYADRFGSRAARPALLVQTDTLPASFTLTFSYGSD